MDFFVSGIENAPTLLFQPGNVAMHRQFDPIVALMQDRYRIVTVDFDGYDETGKTTYTTAKDQAEKLAAHIRENLSGRVDRVFAESLGSAPAIFLTETGVDLGGLILSGAQYLDLGVFNRPFVAWAAPFSYKMFSKMLTADTIKFPKFLERKMGRKNEDFGDLKYCAAKNFSKETIRNTFWEGCVLYQHVNRMAPNAHLPLSCWYGENEKNMKKAVKALRRAFPRMEDHPLAGMGHGSSMEKENVPMVVREMEAFMCRNGLI